MSVEAAKVKSTNMEETNPGEEEPPRGCGFLGRYPVVSVLAFAAVGVVCGILLSTWDPEDDDEKETKSILLKWLGLIGDLFIRALKAVVLPLVFVNVVLSVVDMMNIGRTSAIAGVTILMYLTTTVVASILGLVSILLFQGFFEQGDFEDDPPPTVTLGCSTVGYYLTEGMDGAVTCSNTIADGNNEFIIDDITGVFAKKSSGTRNDISLSDTFYDGIFTKLVTSNIFSAFNGGNFAAVVFFAIFFGVALGKLVFKKRSGSNGSGESTLVTFLKEVDAVLITIINWVIMLTPFAVLSLVVRAIGSQSDLQAAFSNVAYLMAAAILAMVVHFIVVDIGFLFFFTKSNPLTYLRHILPAQTTAFACASSAATIPVTLRSVMNTSRVPSPIANFVVPLGATINMDGGAIYFPCCCIWLAYLNGVTPTVASYFLLILLATVGSAGTAPVPSASLVLIITAYNTVFGGTGTPNGFEFILAIDWFMDRLRTTLNVSGDAVVAGIVAARCGDDFTEKSDLSITSNDNNPAATVMVVQEKKETYPDPELDVSC